MRIAIVIEDGRKQIVLTPETDHETACLEGLHDNGAGLRIHKGHYYHCRGGWTRQGNEFEKDSTILVLVNKTAA